MSEIMPLPAPVIEQRASEAIQQQFGNPLELKKQESASESFLPESNIENLSDIVGIGLLALNSEITVEEVPVDVASEAKPLTVINAPETPEIPKEKSEKELFVDDLQSHLQGVEVASDEFVADLIERLKGVKPELLGATGVLIEKMLVNPAEVGITPEVARRSVRSVLLALGLEAKHIEGMAKSTGGYHDKDPQKTRIAHGAITRRNIESLAEVASQNPDAPRILAETYGIRNFYRYRPASLIRQLEDTQRPFDLRDSQLIITAHDDHNGALRDFPKRLEEDPKYTRTIFAEAGSMGDIARILLEVANTKDVLHSVRLERLIIGAHGSRESIVLGTSERGERARVTKNDIARSRAIGNLIEKGILSPYADVILAACSTGKENGLAKIISEKIDVEVVASDQVTSISVDNNNKRTKRSMRFDPSGRGDNRSAAEKVSGSLTRWKARSDSSTTVYRGGKKDNVRDYTLSYRRPGESARRLHR